MRKILTFFIAVFLFNINVSAASLCTYQEQTELNSKAANIKVSYEVVEKLIGDEFMSYIDMYFKISIVNVTEEFYVIVKNSVNDDETTYTYEDVKDGIITFEWNEISEITNFTIQAYTSEETNCVNEKVKTFYLTTPRYNDYSSRAICVDYPDFYLCQKFVTFAPLSEYEFLDKLISYENGEIEDSGEQVEEPEDVSLMDKIFNFINDYKWFIAGAILVVAVVGVIIYKNKTKKQRELGL